MRYVLRTASAWVLWTAHTHPPSGVVYKRGGGLLALRPTDPIKILTQNLAEGKSNLNKRPLWDPPRPLCDIPSGCCSFPGPWTVTCSSLRMLHRVAAFCQPLRPVLLLVLFPRSRSPVVGVPGLCWMWHGVPFARQWRPVVGVLRLCWLLPGSFDCVCCPRTSVHRPSITCLAVFPCV